MYKLVLDLEMCRVPKMYRGRGYKYAFETIQIGAVLYDPAWNRVGELRMYVHPEYGVIDHFIENLTGIRNTQVKNAQVLKDALEDMLRWLGDKEYSVYTWSGTDREQLLHEIGEKKIFSSSIDSFMTEERWIDYQDVFGKRYAFERAISLTEALDMANIDAAGKAHDGLDDAMNTAALIRILELNPDYQLVQYKEEYGETEPLSNSLGSLFAGLDLRIA